MISFQAWLEIGGDIQGRSPKNLPWMFPPAYDHQGLKMVGQIITPKVQQNQNGGIEMTHQEDNTVIGQVLEELIENGMDGLEAAVSVFINEAMKVERSRALGAEPWQRNDQGRGYKCVRSWLRTSEAF